MRAIARWCALASFGALLLGAHCEICEAPQVAVDAAEVLEGGVAWSKGESSSMQPIESALRPPDASGVVCAASATMAGSVMFRWDATHFRRVEGCD